MTWLNPDEATVECERSELPQGLHVRILRNCFYSERAKREIEAAKELTVFGRQTASPLTGLPAAIWAVVLPDQAAVSRWADAEQRVAETAPVGTQERLFRCYRALCGLPLDCSIIESTVWRELSDWTDYFASPRDAKRFADYRKRRFISEYIGPAPHQAIPQGPEPVMDGAESAR